MRRPEIHWPCLVAGSALIAMALLAADSDTSPAPPATRAAPAKAASQTHHLTPIEYFRGLMAMTPVERNRELAKKTPENRAILLAKIQEYEAMPRDVREACLCQTELHWELLDLMKLPPAERAGRIRNVSPLYMPMIVNLLAEWDRVPAATQKELLEQQDFISDYLRLQGSPEAARQKMLDAMTPERRARWAEEMDRWQTLPQDERANLCAQFQHFCSLSAPDRRATVHALSDAERAEMEETLRTFDRLPPQQRAMCISSFGKFATLAPAEQAQFLKNAARWDAMTASERQLWRELVHTMPPMPPGMLRDLPPMPPGFSNLPPMPPNVTAPVIVAQGTKG